MVIENNRLKIECCSYLGGKITSFFHKEKGFELAAQPGNKSEPHLPARGSFAPYAFGMDDAFPNIVAERINWKGKTYFYPDHGEIWCAQFEVSGQTNDSVSLCWKSMELGYYYEKKLYLRDNTLHIYYQIRNEGKYELPCLWTWHGLMRYEEDMEVLLPEGIMHFRNVLDGSELGKVGAVYPLKNDVYDFTKVPRAERKSEVKFYVEDAIKCGRCGLRYPSQNMVCIMEYDAKVLPYFGFWVTAGGFQGDYNCALEPSNGFYDGISIAKGNGKLPVLAAGEGMEFEINLHLAQISHEL